MQLFLFDQMQSSLVLLAIIQTVQISEQIANRVVHERDKFIGPEQRCFIAML
jgi:hypothetical protein